MTKSDAFKILVVDDEHDICSLVCGILEDEGYETATAHSSDQVKSALKGDIPDLVILDIWLQGSERDGLEILKSLKAEHDDLPVIMISGHGNIEMAVAAIRDGAYDFIEKPFKADRLLLMVRRALEASLLRKENNALKTMNRRDADLIGQTSAMAGVLQLIKRVAPTNSRVLITGSQGTGKDVAARMIHQLSTRADDPFYVINCATLHPERVEAEMFGVEEGGHIQPGILEQANGGTVFLDEIADMPMTVQAKILRVLQDQTFVRVNGKISVRTDIRFIASSNKDLPSLIEAGHFRDDLYYRLSVVPVYLPALKERLADIPVLVDYFVDKFHHEAGLAKRAFSSRAISVMKNYDWPGNVRQLKNVVEWSLIMHSAQGDDKAKIDIDGLPPELTGSGDDRKQVHSEGGRFVSTDYLVDLPLREARDVFEREYLRSQISRFDGNISKTAKFIGMERSALHRKLKNLELVHGDAEDLKQRTV